VGLKASVAMCSKMSLTKLLRMAIALLGITSVGVDLLEDLVDVGALL